MLKVFLCPKWLKFKNPSLRHSIQKEAGDEETQELNTLGYNVYWYPNEPRNVINKEVFLEAHQFTEFDHVFIDMDLKNNIYNDKEYFCTLVNEFPLKPLAVIDSGNGVHVYWKIETLDPLRYLELQRRLARHFNTDTAVAQLKQLMRLPGTKNTKISDDFKDCVLLNSATEEHTYKFNDFDTLLHPILEEDKVYCISHYKSAFSSPTDIKVDSTLPNKFKELLQDNDYIKTLWEHENGRDRSTNDMALARALKEKDFTKDEIISVLSNSDKALERNESGRMSYAIQTTEKVWGTNTIKQEITSAVKVQDALHLMQSVDEILSDTETASYGARLECDTLVDNTEHGFRAGQVIGMIGGSGIGKTTLALNMLKWFAEKNPDKHHLFVGLEQNKKEISDRWNKLTNSDKSLNKKVRILSNHQDSGPSLNLSLDDICSLIKEFEKKTGYKLGVVVIDHIGLLAKNSKDTDSQGIMANSKKMKAVAEETKTLIIMQSQASREKAGIGDVELDKSAAYGTVYFESNCDYIMTLWQPLKRLYHEGALTVIAYKFCKIRHKNQVKDKIREDIRYMLFFDPNTDSLRKLKADELDAINTTWMVRVNAIQEEQSRNNSITYQSAV